MKMTAFRILLAALALSLATAWGETCTPQNEMDPATRSAMESAAQQFFGLVSRGDSAGLQAQAIPAVASSFGGITTAIQQNQANLSGRTATLEGAYLLDQDQPQRTNAEFFCGVFNSPDRLTFSIPGLDPGKYGVTIQSVTTPKGPYYVTFVLQQQGTAWKFAGFYPKPRQLQGHPASWFLTQARDYKTKGQAHNAYFYYLMARDLALPVSFVTTHPVEKLDAESQNAVPGDIPQGQPVDLTVNGQTFKVSQMFVLPDQDKLALIVKYQVPDITDTAHMFQQNKDVMKAVVTKYPEFRGAFQEIVARAVAPNGQDYGTPLPMDQIQ